jgi:uncharacterized membrane protein
MTAQVEQADSSGDWSNRWRALALFAMSAQIAVVIGWLLWPTPTLRSAVVALVLCVPLVAPFYGIARGNRYTYKWATLCVAPYFIVGLTEAVASPATRSWAGALLAGALLWFASLLGFLRTTR